MVSSPVTLIGFFCILLDLFFFILDNGLASTERITYLECKFVLTARHQVYFKHSIFL